MEVITAKIKQKALDIGFDLVGITTAESIDTSHKDYFKQWLSEGHAADMHYLYRNIDKRFEPARLLHGAKSVICVAVCYANLNTSSDCKIASFGHYEDYHPAIKSKLFELAEYIGSQCSEKVGFKACVDSVPLAERALAQRAGLGFIGKSRMLIHPELGNRLLLGELITTLELKPDKALNHPGCHGCNKCISACPAKALNGQGGFDAHKCISYLSIEEKNNLPPECRLNNYIFGCDECINTCPCGKLPAKSPNSCLKPRPEWLSLTRQQILDMTQQQFDLLFANSGIQRLGLDRLKRNCLV